jgi:hypothetical protein
LKSKQPELPGAKPQARTEPPATLDYLMLGTGDYWRVEKFRDFSSEFPLAGTDYEGQMGQFHQLALQLSRSWDFTRRLFGINPVILPDSAAPDEYRRLSRRELCEAKGITAPELRADLDQLRAMWQQFNQQVETEAVGLPEAEVRGQRSEVSDPKPAAEVESKQQEEERIIREAGFDPRMFDDVKVFDPHADSKIHPGQVVSRPKDKNDAERTWFAQRCHDSRTMLEVPMARMQVRDMLQNELSLSRIQDRMTMMVDGSAEFERADRRKGELQERYEKQMDKLQEMFPDLNVASRVSYRQTIAMLFAAEQDFYANGDNKRRTALFTAAELQVLSRQSQQLPQPQYKLSLEFLAMESIHGLYNREFRSDLAKKPRALKLIDSIGRAAIDAARQAQGIPLTDLEAGVLPGEPGTDEFEEVIVFQKA